MFSFEKLDVWQEARQFAREVCEITRTLPKHEQFALSQQLRRAAVSIAANLAEGSSRSSKKEFSRYVEMAFGSLCEVVAELYVALDSGYVPKEVFDDLYARSERLGRMMSRFRTSLETSWLVRDEAKNQAIRPSDHPTGAKTDQTIKPSDHPTAAKMDQAIKPSNHPTGAKTDRTIKPSNYQTVARTK